MFTHDDPRLKQHIIILFAYFFNFGICVLMTGFLKFHIKLASENKTTIESLDKQGAEFKSPYDIGRSENLK